MAWLITYSQKTRLNSFISTTVNTASVVPPAVWLAEAIERSPDGNTVLIFSTVISDSQYDRLKDIL